MKGWSLCNTSRGSFSILPPL
uniref:Uncharacterized protein n=1 Tax=Nelumbo nucifera TaxID=4432 RepID=A0A822Y3A1_NELNU|nr:TPA_asm: hypothetical protein HUJ06_027519 [Nelumbo nucifera]